MKRKITLTLILSTFQLIKNLYKKKLPLDIALFHNTFIIKNEKKIIQVICEKLN